MIQHSGDDAPSAPLDPQDDAWRARRAELDRRLGASRARDPDNSPPDRSAGMRGMAEGFKVASEFVAGVVVGAAIGYGIDRLFGTLPFGLIFFLMIGFAAGVVNVVRSAGKTSGPSPR